MMEFCFIYFQVPNKIWTSHHRTSIVETFMKSELVTTTEMAFRVHFGLGRHDSLRSRNTILGCITNFKGTRSALKRK